MFSGLLYGEGCLYDSVLLKDTRGRQLRGLGPPAVREGRRGELAASVSFSASKLQDSGSQGSQLKLKHKDQEPRQRKEEGAGKSADPG